MLPFSRLICLLLSQAVLYANGQGTPTDQSKAIPVLICRSNGTSVTTKEVTTTTKAPGGSANTGSSSSSSSSGLSAKAKSDFEAQCQNLVVQNPDPEMVFQAKLFENSASIKEKNAISTQIVVKLKARVKMTGYKLGCGVEGFPKTWKVFDEFNNEIESQNLGVPCDKDRTFEVSAISTPSSNTFTFEFYAVSPSPSLEGNPEDILQLGAPMTLYWSHTYGLMLGEWGECSKACEGGKQTRSVDCGHIYTGQARNYRYCNFQSEAIFDQYKTQDCNPHPCDCTGMCLEHGECKTSSDGYPTLPCPMMFDGARTTGWFSRKHKDFTTIDGTADPKWQNNDHRVKPDGSAAGVIDWISTIPYYKGKLAGSYLLQCGSDYLGKAPIAWKLYAGQKAPKKDAATLEDFYTGMTLIDVVTDFPGYTKKDSIAIFDRTDRVTNQHFMDLYKSVENTPHFKQFKEYLVIPSTEAIVDEERWQYYRIEFEQIAGNTYKTDQILQAQSFPVQLAVKEWNLYLHGLSFGMYTGPWSVCDRICSGGKQTRVVECKASDGMNYPKIRCPDYDEVAHVTEKTCNESPCLPPGEIQQITLSSDQYDIIELTIDIASPGGTVVCAAFQKIGIPYISGLIVEDESHKFPDHLENNQTAIEHIAKNQKNIRQSFSIACNPPQCKGSIKHLSQNVTQRIYCGVEDEGLNLHLQYAHDTRTLRGPQLQRYMGSIGCFRDHLINHDLPVRVHYGDEKKSVNLTEGECSFACKDYHYFGIQDWGHCYCGNDEHRKWGPGNLAVSMTAGCDCDGPFFGQNVHCVWEQVPALIDGVNEVLTRVYATEMTIGLDLDKSEVLFKEGEIVQIRCDVASYGSMSLGRRELEVAYRLDPYIPDSRKLLEAPKVIGKTTADNPEKAALIVHRTPRKGRSLSQGVSLTESTHLSDYRDLQMLLNIPTARRTCMLNTTCVLDFTDIPANYMYNVECREDVEIFLKRHTLSTQRQTSRIALMNEPIFGAVTHKIGKADIMVRNMDFRSITIICSAQNSENESLVHASDEYGCGSGDDCYVKISDLQFGQEYQVWCTVKSGKVTEDIAPLMKPSDAFSPQSYTIADYWVGSVSNQDKEGNVIDYSGGADTAATNTGSSATDGRPPMFPPATSTRGRVSWSRQKAAAEDQVSFGYVVLIVAIGIVFITIAYFWFDGFKGKFEGVFQYPDEISNERVGMALYEFLQWYDFFSDVSLISNVNKIQNPSEYLNNMQHFGIVIISWSSCVFLWSCWVMGGFPMIVDSFGKGGRHQYRHKAREPKHKDCSSNQYMLFVFPVSIFSWFIVSDPDVVWQSFAAKQYFRRILTVLNDLMMFFFCILLLGASGEADVHSNNGSGIAHSMVSSCLMVIYAHTIVHRIAGPIDKMPLGEGKYSKREMKLQRQKLPGDRDAIALDDRVVTSRVGTRNIVVGDYVGPPTVASPSAALGAGETIKGSGITPAIEGGIPDGNSGIEGAPLGGSSSSEGGQFGAGNDGDPFGSRTSGRPGGGSPFKAVTGSLSTTPKTIVGRMNLPINTGSSRHVPFEDEVRSDESIEIEMGKRSSKPDTRTLISSTTKPRVPGTRGYIGNTKFRPPPNPRKYIDKG